MSNMVATAVDGIRTGLPLGLAAGAGDTFARGFRPGAFLGDLFFCTLGGLIGASSYRWLITYRAFRKTRQPPVGTHGEGI